jgi:hypothetical protein
VPLSPLLTLRREIQKDLTVIENWNSTIDFILFSTGGEIATNRQEDQELMMLALHLLQNCLVFINTLMIQRLLSEAAWEKRAYAQETPTGKRRRGRSSHAGPAVLCPGRLIPSLGDLTAPSLKLCDRTEKRPEKF